MDPYSSNKSMWHDVANNLWLDQIDSILNYIFAFSDTNHQFDAFLWWIEADSAGGIIEYKMKWRIIDD